MDWIDIVVVVEEILELE